MNLKQLAKLFSEAGATRLLAKPLAENDNSKNQIYFAGAVEALNVFPSKQIFAENTSKGPSFKACLDFAWLQENGCICPAPRAKLILYSQYPEVRFSGFLQGCKGAPSDLMMDRQRAKKCSPEGVRRLVGRILFLGITADDRVLGYVAAGDSQIAAEFNSSPFPCAVVVFREIPLPNTTSEFDSRNLLLAELRRIHLSGWINSKQLSSDGVLKPCRALNCGGFTLEAELGIPKNSDSKPDFRGWEVKQHSVTGFARPPSSSPITLMTPEPSFGFYREHGIEAFVRKFGYPDKKGRSDRYNFGGRHRVGIRHPLTGLRMELQGYDAFAGKITDACGAVALVSIEGQVAAAWPFSSLFAHWSRKHMRAVYVPSMRRKDPCWQYAYGGNVRLAQGTNPLRLVTALAGGCVYYDPGIKLENVSTSPKFKQRSQFRVPSKSIGELYDTLEIVQV